MARRRRTVWIPAVAVSLGLVTVAATAPAAGAAPAAAAARAAAAPGATRPDAGWSADRKQPTAVGTGGAVASIDLDASRAGIAVLRSGGNAIDAAVAMAATLGVTEPYVAGPGGGGFLVAYLARTGQVVTIDGRETCPRACTQQLFLDPETGQPLPFEEARRSGLSVGVPGMVAQWEEAARRYGSRPLAADLAPAITVAERGFRVDEAFREESTAALADLRAFRPSRELFLTPDGQPLPTGYLLRNPDLARTYRLLARDGARALYQGPLAEAIARTVQQPPTAEGTPPVRAGGMTAADLAAYQAKSRPPTTVGYRGLDVYGMAPPSSGGSTVGEALNILAGYDLGREDRARALHHYLEASRYAFADRNAYVGDPDQVPVPLAGLLSPGYAATRRCLITDRAASSPVPPGDPVPPYAGCPTAGTAAAGPEGASTNHLVAADRWGNVVSYTNTIEQIAGSGMTVPGYGFLLNNELTDFDFAPSVPDTADPNLPAGGKRPRSSMSPTIVLAGGRPVLALGSRGGSTIITTVLQTLVNAVDFGQQLPQALAAPRITQRDTPASLAEPAFLETPEAGTLQRQFGQSFTEKTGPLAIDREIGSVTAVAVAPGGRLEAAAEPVRPGGGSALVVRPTR